MHQRCMGLGHKEVANITSAINRALHMEGINDTRVDRVRFMDTGRILGITTPNSILQGLLKYRGTVLKAVQVVDNSISDVVVQQNWKWIRIHISLVRHMGGKDGDLRRLQEELEAENSEVSIPAEIGWLGGAEVRARFQEFRCGTSSAAAAVLGEATFGRLRKSGVRLLEGPPAY